MSAAVPNASVVSATSAAVSQLIRLSGPTFGRTAAVRPQGCKDLNLTAAQAGAYFVWPNGPQQGPLRVFCTSLVDPITGAPSLFADWTVIIADVNGTYPSNLNDLYSSMPTTTTNGAQSLYLRADLRALGTRLYVINEASQSHIFKLSEFGGPVIIDGNNWVGSDNHPSTGIVAGNNHPVVFHFQVDSVCNTPHCYVSCNTNLCGQTGDRCCVDTRQRYSSPIFAMFDWDPVGTTANPNLHASFGGTNLTRTRWSYKGTLLALQ